MTADPFGELTAIVRERHETGAYGNCRLDMHPRLHDRMRAAVPEVKPPEWAFLADPMARMLAIPIVRERTLPEGAWRLVAMDLDREPPYTRHETIVKEGTVPE